MRSILAIVGYVAAAVIAGSILAWSLEGALDVSYDRRLSRAVLLFMALGLWPLCRVLNIDWHSTGLSAFDWRRVGVAFLAGIILIVPPMLFFYLVEFRVADDRVDMLSGAFAGMLAMALLSAALVALFEETLFRGVWFGRLRETWALWPAVSVTSAAYAVVHFIDTALEPIGEVAWYTGIVLTGVALTSLTQLLVHWDSLLALILLGIVFCLTRERYGLWACIGLHGAFVFAIKIYKELTVRDVVSPYRWLVGEYDNFVGILVAGWLVLLVTAWCTHRYANSGTSPQRAWR